MLNFVLGFGTCLAIAVMAPSMFVAIKAKAVATINAGITKLRSNTDGE